MNTASLSAERNVDGRTVVDELPRRVGVLPGELELVAQHLLEVLQELLAEKPGSAKPAHRKSEHGTRHVPEGEA